MRFGESEMKIVKAIAILLLPLSVIAQLKAEIVTPTSATETSAFSGFSATRLIDGSGLDGEGEIFAQRHDNNVFNMWLSDSGTIANQQEIEFELDGTFDLSTAIIWQHNGIDGQGNPTQERDLTEFEIQVSPDLVTPFVTLDDFMLNGALDPLDPSGEPPQFLVLDGAFNVRRVKFKVISAAGGPEAPFVGLSEVRFDGTRVGDAPVKTWTVDAAGDWVNDLNWSPAAPNGTAESAVFGDVITSPRTISADQPVTVKAITFENTNTYVIAGAEAINLNSNDDTATVTVTGGAMAGNHQFQAAVNLVDNTNVIVGDGASLEFVNRLDLGGNSMTKTGEGTLTFSNTLNAGGGAVDCQQGICNGSGNIAGNLTNSGAQLAPGNSPGRLSVDGTFVQTADGTLNIELGGTVPGDEYDQLVVDGTVDLAGTLSVTLLDGFDPSPGSSFEVVTGSSIVDSGIVLRGRDAELFRMTVGASSVVLEVVGGADCDFDGSGVCDIMDLDELLYVGLVSGDVKYDLDGNGSVDLGDRDAFLDGLGTVPGDFDRDGKVRASDLNILGGNWTREDLTSYGQGDANGDGIANATDLNAIGANWQFGAAAAQPVPEPSMLTAFVLGLFGLVSVKRSSKVRSRNNCPMSPLPLGRGWVRGKTNTDSIFSERS